MATRRGNHEGSTPIRRKDGRWQVAVRFTDEDGQRVRRTVTGKTAQEARKRGQELVKRLKAGQPARDSRETVSEAAERWIRGPLEASDRKPATVSLYASLARSHVVGSTLGGMRLDKVQKANVDAWLAGLKRKGLAGSTRRTTFIVLRAILEDAVANGRLAKNPAALSEPPRVEQQEAAYLTREQVAALLEAAETSRYRPLFELLLATGLRRGEALALRWRQDVDEKAGVIHVRGTLARQDGRLVVSPVKTAKSARRVPMSPRVAELLRAVKAEQRRERLRAGSKWTDSGHVFTTELGQPVDPRNALRALQVAAKRAGLEGVGLHTLRHTGASLAIASGVHLKVISELWGHSSVSITGDVYSHVTPELSRDAMAAISDALG